MAGTSEISVTLGGLTALELAELRQSLAAVGADAQAVMKSQPEAGLSGARKGEPMTMLAIVVLSQVAMNAIALYLSKGRAKIKKRERLRVTDAQGSTMEYELEVEGQTETEVKAAFLKQLAALKIAVPEFGGAAPTGSGG